MEEQLVAVNNLTVRYGIGNTGLYKRMRTLGIKPRRRGVYSFITQEELKQLDMYHYEQTREEQFNIESENYTSPIEEEVQETDIELAPKSEIAEKNSEQIAYNPLTDAKIAEELLWYCNNGLAIHSQRVRQILQRSVLVKKEYTLFGLNVIRNGDWWFIKKYDDHV